MNQGRHFKREVQLLDQLSIRDTSAERSKAVAQGAIPKGRGLEPHRCHFDEVACQATPVNLRTCDEVKHLTFDAAVFVFLDLRCWFGRHIQ